MGCSEGFMILVCVSLIGQQGVTDRQTDRQTDGPTPDAFAIANRPTGTGHLLTPCKNRPKVLIMSYYTIPNNSDAEKRE